MARLRRSNLLTCFYCGKRSSIPNDGSHQSFLCLYCDATNYVDENGEITDPPVATEREAPAPRYVSNQPSASPPSSRKDNIFCETCLKNQRLFTASLAQYLPDDPSDPLNDPLDKKYYKFRRDLEERYPQVCADCEGRVQGRLRAAGYTAQTDHLRRLMANTRGRRPRKKLTKLDLAEKVGRLLWWMGLVLQMLWHIKMVATILELTSEAEAGMVDPDSSKPGAAGSLLSHASQWLPEGDLLIRASISLAIISVWWNPRFVQLSRGFSRHLLGFRQWYCFQGLIVFFRIISRRVGEMRAPLTETASALIMPHVMMACLMLLISLIARNSIRMDTQALFGFSPVSASPYRSPATKIKPQQSQLDGPNEAHSQSSRAQVQAKQATLPQMRSLPNPRPPPVPFRSSPSSQLAFHQRQSFGAPDSPIVSMNEPEEMDWTPTQSQHRAFSSMPPAGTPSRPFSQAPVQPESGPFWYKVPPAPTNPAHKLRNPTRPVIRSQTVDADQRGTGFTNSFSMSQNRPEARTNGVEFQAPTFFAPTKDDERSSLADMLNRSFTLGNELQQEDIVSMPLSQSSENRTPLARAVSPRMPVLSGLLLVIWTMTFVCGEDSGIPHIQEVKLCVTAFASCLALSCMGRTVEGPAGQIGGANEVWALISPIFEVAELFLLCYVGWESYTGQGEVDLIGLAVLLFGFVQRMATAFGQKGLGMVN